MSTLHLACGSSVDYLPHAAAMIHSALQQRGSLDLHVHYLHGPDLPSADGRRLREMVERGGGALALHEVADHRIAGLPSMEFIPATMWYRTFLPEVLPDVDRVLYLDADTIAVDSLEDLWDTVLGDCYVAGVSNVWEPWNLDYPVAGLGLESPDHYFNSGVLLMDLAQMRRDGMTARILDFARTRDSLPWGDQDALNAVMAGRWLPLHPRWNCMNSVLNFPRAIDVFGAEAVAEARRRPGIRHFEGPTVNKPWHVLCEWELRELYMRHRRATPWPEVQLEGRTPRAIVTLAGRRVRRLLAPRTAS